MMTTYTRRGPGQGYLKTVLADRINGLIELKDLDLEINPLKVYERMIEQIEEDTGSFASIPKERSDSRGSLRECRSAAHYRA